MIRSKEILRNAIVLGGLIAGAGLTQMHKPVFDIMNSGTRERTSPTTPTLQPYHKPDPYTTEQKAIIAALSKPTESETIPIADNRRNLIHYIDYMKELVINRGGKQLQAILENDDFSYEVDIGPARHGSIKETEDKSVTQVPIYIFPLPTIIVEIITDNPPKPADRISWPFEVVTRYNKNGRTVEITFAAQSKSSGDGWRFIPKSYILQDVTPPGGY